MIQQLLQEPAFLVVMGFHLLACLACLVGILFVVRDILNNHWKRECEAVHAEIERRRLKLAQLGCALDTETHSKLTEPLDSKRIAEIISKGGLSEVHYELHRKGSPRPTPTPKPRPR